MAMMATNPCSPSRTSCRLEPTVTSRWSGVYKRLSQIRQFHHRAALGMHGLLNINAWWISAVVLFENGPRSNNVLTLQSVSPLRIVQSRRVRALWSIQSSILLETERILLKRIAVSQNYIMDHAIHSAKHVEFIYLFFSPLYFPAAFFPGAFSTAHAFSNYTSVSGCWIENAWQPSIFASRRFNEVMNQQRTSLFPRIKLAQNVLHAAVLFLDRRRY